MSFAAILLARKNLRNVFKAALRYPRTFNRYSKTSLHLQRIYCKMQPGSGAKPLIIEITPNRPILNMHNG